MEHHILLNSEVVEASTVFSDDFNDNSLDVTKWIMDVTGNGNSFAEQNQQAEFTVLGQRKGYDYEHSILWSKVINVKNWETITISGKWKFTNPYTAEMNCIIYDTDTNNRIGVTYGTWTTYYHEHIRYYTGTNAIHEDRTIPRNYVTFRIVVYKGYYEYWENGDLIKTVYTTAFDDAEKIKIRIGGWDYSPGTEYIYFDDIVVSYTPKQTPVPEFPPVAIGILGFVLILMFRRK